MYAGIKIDVSRSNRRNPDDAWFGCVSRNDAVLILY